MGESFEDSVRRREYMRFNIVDPRECWNWSNAEEKFIMQSLEGIYEWMNSLRRLNCSRTLNKWNNLEKASFI